MCNGCVQWAQELEGYLYGLAMLAGHHAGSMQWILKMARREHADMFYEGHQASFGDFIERVLRSELHGDVRAVVMDFVR